MVKRSIMTNLTLNVLLNENLPDKIVEYYTNSLQERSNYSDDSGFDLPAIEDVRGEFFKTSTVNFGISACMVNDDTHEILPYYLYARSSFSKYPIIFSNSVGIIDKGYRGNIKGKVVFLPNLENFYIPQNTKLFQICSNDLTPFKVKIVQNLPESSRGKDGFGSTGI